MSHIRHHRLSVSHAGAEGPVVLHVADTGPLDPNALTVVLVHGWPECWLSWRAIGLALGRAGYRVLMPDNRGFGESSCPRAVGAYSMFELERDYTGLLDALNVRSAVFVGHDWGGAVVWRLAHGPARARVRAVAGVCTPFPPRGRRDPFELMKRRPRQFEYQLYFQEPGEAEGEFTGDEEFLFRAMMRRWHEMPRELDMSRVRQRGGLLKGVPRELEQSSMLSDEELAGFVQAYRTSGWHGGLNWYRNLSRNWEYDCQSADYAVRQPALMVTAENDAILTPAMSLGMEERAPRLQRATLEDCGHWAQMEQPEKLTEVLLNWLSGLDGVGAGGAGAAGAAGGAGAPGGAGQSRL